MELEDSEDLDEVPTNRPVPERQAQPQYQSQPEGHAVDEIVAPAM